MSDQLKRHLFTKAVRNAQPEIGRLARDSKMSVSLIDKIRWKKRRPTDRALHALADGLEIHTYSLREMSRLLRGTVETNATDYVYVSCDKDGMIDAVSVNVLHVFGVEPDVLLGASYKRLFLEAPDLVDGDEGQRVVVRRGDGELEPATTYVTQFDVSRVAYTWWSMAVLISDPSGPRAEPPGVVVAQFDEDRESP